MDLELVTVGTELLLGFTLDTNGAEIARRLAAAGIRVVRRTAVGDRADEIKDGVAQALRRSGAVLTTGGLGPTRDDITKLAVAELYGAELDFDESIWADLLARFARLGRAPVASNRTQAQVPRGALVLRNRWGTAPGLWLEGVPGLTIMLPGVPQEMRMLLEHEVLPRMASRAGAAVIRSRTVRTTGIAESTLAERMGDVETEIAPLTLAYLPGLDGVDLRLTAWQLGKDEAERRLAAAAELLSGRGGEHVYGEDQTDLAALVLERARQVGWSLGTAESCTGGLVAVRLTEIPGSSDVFLGSAVCYSNRLKTELVDVPPAVIEAHGAVSEAVARAMAEGACRRLGVDLAVAVTGIAGPDGGTPQKPVGLVWFAAADRHGTVARSSVVLGTRREIRARGAQAALNLLRIRLLPGSDR
jgi:nicotinamide-nucleotide amidase